MGEPKAQRDYSICQKQHSNDWGGIWTHRLTILWLSRLPLLLSKCLLEYAHKIRRGRLGWPTTLGKKREPWSCELRHSPRIRSPPLTPLHCQLHLRVSTWLLLQPVCFWSFVTLVDPNSSVSRTMTRYVKQCIRQTEKAALRWRKTTQMSGTVCLYTRPSMLFDFYTFLISLTDGLPPLGPLREAT